MPKTKTATATTVPVVLHSSGIRLAHNVYKTIPVSSESPTRQSTILGMGLPVAETLRTYAAQTLLERTGFFYDDQYIFPDEETHPLTVKELSDLTRIEMRELYNYKSMQIAQYKKDIAAGIERPEVIIKSDNNADNTGNSTGTKD